MMKEGYTDCSKDRFSLRLNDNKEAFRQGMRDGIPIGMGYFAVSFSLGIAVMNTGLTPLQGLIMSFLCNASAGEYAGLTVIGAASTYLEMAFITFIVNARYMLMSCAMSQRMAPGTSMKHRLLMSFGITDELFGIAISRSGYLNPNYSYGAFIIASPCWAIGTALGCIAGNAMPERLVSALSVALFGMFLAVIIPPARKNKVVAGLVAVCFAASYGAAKLPVISDLSAGSRTIILTVIISAAAAVLFPRDTEEADEG